MKLIPKYQNGNAIRTDADKKVPKYNRAIYSSFDATWDTPYWYALPSKGTRVAYKQITNPDTMDYTVTDSVADAGWRKRLGLSYDSKFLLPNKDGSVRLSKNVESEIPTDTTLLKNRINSNRKLSKSPTITGDNWKLVQGMINVDQGTLDSLRMTYRTGKPTVINESSNNSRNLFNNGQLVKDAHTYKSPLNILKNFTVQYNAKNRTMAYKDIYDFGNFESFIPGKPYNIKGSINLDKK